MVRKKKLDIDFLVENGLLDQSSGKLYQTDSKDQTPKTPVQDRTRNIIGTDDRVRVENTLFRPFRWVCQIFAASSFETVKAVGTGAIIGKSTILTAAHNLFVNSHRAEQFHIYLACDGDRLSPPLGHFVAGTAVPHPRFKESQFDIAVILLDNPLPSNLVRAPDIYGVLPLAEVEPNSLNGQKGFVTGYPKSYPERAQDDPSKFPTPVNGVQAFQYYCVSDLRFSNGLIRYDLDTTAGQSGSPLIAVQEDSNGRQFSVGIGVHIEGNDAGNASVPLDAEKMAFVIEMLNRHESNSFV